MNFAKFQYIDHVLRLWWKGVDLKGSKTKKRTSYGSHYFACEKSSMCFNMRSLRKLIDSIISKVSLYLSIHSALDVLENGPDTPTSNWIIFMNHQY